MATAARRATTSAAAVAAALLALALGGCTQALGPGWARLETHQISLPLVYTSRSIILGIDGRTFGPRYRSVRLPAGYHEVHAVFMDCPLPALVVTCLETALETTIPFVAEAGETYVLRRGGETAWIEAAGVAELRLAEPPADP